VNNDSPSVGCKGYTGDCVIDQMARLLKNLLGRDAYEILRNDIKLHVVKYKMHAAEKTFSEGSNGMENN
jgi:hypothetical protein